MLAVIMAVAFYTGEITQGLNKVCYYNHLGSIVTLTVRAVELCPLTVEVDD